MRSFCQRALCNYHPHRLLRLSLILLVGSLGACKGAEETGHEESPATEPYTLLVHNSENLFDLDKVAQFDDYEQGEGKPYGPAKLYGKLKNLAAVLQTVQDGKGPDIIAFQELEFDFTPDSTVDDYSAFLKKYDNTTVREMLLENFDENEETFRGLPAEAWILKALHDKGMHGYNVAYLPEPHVGNRLYLEDTRPHVNVVFSRFPIEDVRAYPIPQAREIQEVHLNIDGAKLYLFNNHWKSNRGGVEKTEKMRVKAAKTLRKRLGEIQKQDPQADIIIAGDFNSHYQQSRYHPSMSTTGINDILGAQGDEQKIIEEQTFDILYSLYYDLPPERRRSDFYKGRWGTLMNIIINHNLYDFHGIQYVDNSFRVVEIPGLNVDETWGLPKDWKMSGPYGSGVSDHLPLLAKFKVIKNDAPDKYLELKNPGKERKADTTPLKVNFDNIDKKKLLDPSQLKTLAPESLYKRYGETFHVQADVNGHNPRYKHPIIQIGSHQLEIYAYDDKVREKLQNAKVGTTLEFYGKLGEYKGRKQFVLMDPDWLLKVGD